MRTNSAQHRANQTGRERKLVSEEIVRMLGLYAEGRKCLWREVLQVLGFDSIAPSNDSGRQNVPIIGSRHCDGRHEGLTAGS